ncbi:protein trachealess-like [Culicoides brevitarsis]|uniref:protein trachealess-like n=1 Tax=Culicoides brevitarsis TaxID=469753 RepID=UPI00307B5878
MDHHGGSYASPWAAVLSHHGMPGSEHHPGFAAAHHSNYSVPMDLHVPQSFSYYRYREDPFCWAERKPTLEEVQAASSANQRILELRKEKSRDAARNRRGKENYEFYELAKMLPLPAAITSQLDKASIIRLTISYLKLRDFSQHGDPSWTRDSLSTSSKILKSASARRTAAGMAVELFEQHQGTHILQSLDGFALAVAADGRFLYISETVSIYLGLSQVEMTGSSIFDYVHHGDHAEIAEQLGLSLASGNTGMNSPHSIHSDEPGSSHGTNNPDVAAQMTLSSNSAYKGYDRAFCIRMKSTLTKRGCHFKSSGYRASEEASEKLTVVNPGGKGGKTTSNHYVVVLVLCRLRTQYNFTQSKKSQPQLMGIVGLAVALPPPSIHEIRLECDMFVTRINFDFTIAHCEPRVTDLLEYTPEELLGRSIYSLCHGEDASKLRKCHTDLINKGQVLTHYYRIMNKNGGYTWIQTCATVICSSKNADEQNIICVNYVVSRKENANLILDTCQMDSVKLEDMETSRMEHSSDSPGSGPSNEGNNGRNARNSTDLKSSKAKSREERQSRRANAVNGGDGNTTNLNLATEKVTEPQQSTRGRKRKVKYVPTTKEEEENEGVSSAKIANIEENGGADESNRAETSVKDLETAMSKHLPSTTDFSTDTLLKHQQQAQQSPEKSWSNTGHFHQQTGAPMPATALLRQLYANRESVIRATTSRSGNGSFYPETIQSSALPTPPGSESSYDTQYTTLHHQKPSDAFTNLVSAYGTYSSAAMEYQSAMTPPSSVSPRDSSSHHVANKHSSTYDSYISSVYSEQNSSESSLPPLPLKPQAYSAAAAMHSSIADSYSSAIDQSQYFPHPTGFHLYHKGQGWYSTPT